MPAPIAYDAPLHPADQRRPDAGARSILCNRCKIERSTIVLQTALFCRQCFLRHFESKTRASLEQVKVCSYIHRSDAESTPASSAAAAAAANGTSSSIQDPSPSQSNLAKDRNTSPHRAHGRVAIGLSGGPSSVALMHLAKRRLLPPPGFEQQTGKSFEIFGIDVIYVDDSALFPGQESRVHQVQRLVEECANGLASIRFIAVKLEDVFERNEGSKCTMGPSARRTLDQDFVEDDSIASLTKLFDALKPAHTPRTMLANARSRIEDMHRLLISHLLRREACRLGARCLLTGETATRRAIRIVDGISRGRGHKLPLEEGQARWRGLFTLQPLADALAKEIAYFLRTESLNYLEPRDLVATELLASNLGGNNGDKASIHRLSESLIHLLERNVPGTINTVTRTGGKLIFSDSAASHGYEQDANASEEKPGMHVFDQVGPVLPLRFRRRLDSSMSSIDEKSASLAGRGLPDVRGMGLGGLGAKLYSVAKGFPQYSGRFACPLCQMPAQRGIDAWKRGLTVSKDDKEKIAIAASAQSAIPSVKAGTGLDLGSLLCYACNILLDTPETTPADASVLLPSHVLREARERLKDRELAQDAPTEEIDLVDGMQSAHIGAAIAQPTSSEQQQEAYTLRKVDPAQMRERVDEFLLNGDEPELNNDMKHASQIPALRPSHSAAATRNVESTDW